ncbi:hypothetical protein OTB20_32865 [Streptomyces sp. H27-H1]|nr:hypothetical protein [Streptomyces sp. H27-H1]
MSQPLPPEAPPLPGHSPEPSTGWTNDTSGGEDDGDGEPGEDWWRFEGVREEWRDTWSEHGQEGLQAAHEIGVTIGEAVISHLPSPEAAAEKRGLDIRWLRLKYNVPAIALALLVTWNGESLAGSVARSIAVNGPFALLGWILLPALALGLLMLTPIGGPLGHVLVDLIRTVLYGLGRVVARAWTTTFTGYLLRLVAAVVVWGVIFGVTRLIWRVAVNWLTGA